MFAYVYPVLSIFWSMLIFFGFVIWIYLLFAIFADLFRSDDVGGFAKAMWTLGLLFLPLVGVLLYLVVRGSGMHARAEERAAQQQAAFDQYIRDTAASAPPSRAGSSTQEPAADRADAAAGRRARARAALVSRRSSGGARRSRVGARLRRSPAYVRPGASPPPAASSAVAPASSDEGSAGASGRR